jgi:hypothetical protein
MSMLSNDIGYCREKKLMKSILVPTGGSDTDSALFETALAVARLFSSHLQFLHIHIGAGEAALNVPHAEFAMGPLYRTPSKSWSKAPPSVREPHSDTFATFVHDRR